MSPTTPDTNETPNRSRPPCGRGARGILKAAAALLALGLTFWLLWNWVAVPLFTFPPLTYLQGLGAVLLTTLPAGIWATARRRRLTRSPAWPHGCADWGRCFGNTGKRDM